MRTLPVRALGYLNTVPVRARILVYSCACLRMYEMYHLRAQTGNNHGGTDVSSRATVRARLERRETPVHARMLPVHELEQVASRHALKG